MDGQTLILSERFRNREATEGGREGQKIEGAYSRVRCCLYNDNGCAGSYLSDADDAEVIWKEIDLWKTVSFRNYYHNTPLRHDTYRPAQIADKCIRIGFICIVGRLVGYLVDEFRKQTPGITSISFGSSLRSTTFYTSSLYWSSLFNALDSRVQVQRIGQECSSSTHKSHKGFRNPPTKCYSSSSINTRNKFILIMMNRK